LPTKRTFEMLVAQYRDYEVTVYGRESDWEFGIRQGKWLLADHRKVNGSREVAQKAASEHLFSLLTKNEKKRYKVDALAWRDWVEDTRKWVARSRDRPAGRRA
jgi:hypothetical protein